MSLLKCKGAAEVLSKDHVPLLAAAAAAAAEYTDATYESRV